MDPLTLWAFCIATAWVAQRLWTDGVAKVQGRIPPSVLARERRYELAQRRVAETGSPGLRAALADRLAFALAHPPERRFAREARAYLDDVLADAAANARYRHREKQRERAAARGEEPPPEPRPWLELDDAAILEEEFVEDAIVDETVDETGHNDAVADAVADDDVIDEQPHGHRRCRHCVDNEAAFGDELCPSCREWINRLAGQPAPTDPTPPAGHPDRETARQGRCGHRLYGFEKGPDCGKCAREQTTDGVDDDGEATHGLYRCGGGCGTELVERPGQYGPVCAARDREDYPSDARRCGRCRAPLPTFATGPDCTRCLVNDHDAARIADQDTDQGVDQGVDQGAAAASTSTQCARPDCSDSAVTDMGLCLPHDDELLLAAHSAVAAAEAAGHPTFTCAGITDGHRCTTAVHEHGQLCPDCARHDADDELDDLATARQRRTPDDNPMPSAGPSAESTDDAATDDSATDDSATDDSAPYDMPAVVDGEVVPPSTPEPDQGPGSTTTSTTASTTSNSATSSSTEGSPMTQAQPAGAINPDINDPTGARRFTVNKTTTLRDIAAQYERMIAAARTNKLGENAIAELAGIYAALLRVAGTVELATDEFTKDVLLQREIAENEDLKRTVEGTYTDGARAS